MKLITAVARGFQLLFSAIVLGLSISLIKGQRIGSAPIRQGYSAFAGAFGVAIALFGIAAAFVDALASSALASWIPDAIAAFALLAGGIIMALGLKGTKCSDISKIYVNELIAGGNKKIDGSWGGYYYWTEDKSALTSRCTQATAEVTFEFLACILFIVTIAYTFLNRKKASSSYGV